MSRNERVNGGSDTINDLAVRRAAITSAPLPPVARGGMLVDIELDKIEPNPDQPRQWIDPEKIEELAASIASRGTRQPDNPILVRPAPSGDRFLLVSGERRWRAKQLLRERARFRRVTARFRQCAAAEVRARPHLSQIRFHRR